MGCESTNYQLSKKQINFQKIDTGILDNGPSKLKTAVKLEFILRNVDMGKQYSIGVTQAENSNSFYTDEAICSSPNYEIRFHKCYICDYFFERQQYLNLTLITKRENQGYIRIPLGIIIGSPNSTYNTEFPDNKVNLTIIGEEIKDTNSFIDVNLSAQNLDKNFNEIKDKISYRISGNSGNIIYQSESINHNGIFDPIRIPLALLEPSFKVTFVDSLKNDITFRQETPDNFTNANQNTIYLGFSSNKSRINIINKSKIFHHFTFIDYLKSGVTIKLTIGIDFTSSNLPPGNPDSLHYIGGGMNDYELAIQACGKIVAYYDYNQLFPVYGFGAVIKGQNKPNMCFNVNFKSNPEVYTIDNVLNEYRKCFQNIILAGPTEFCPLVQKVNETIRKENDPLKYHILMILTDGVIYDQQKTIDVLVEGSFLPLSVIIIGIGNDHFQEMIQLDGDEIPLISSNGVKRMRDLVQFVPYNKFRNDPNELAAQVLEEVPRQIMEYYTMNNIYPYNLAKSQINKFGFNNNSNMGLNNQSISNFPMGGSNYYENNNNNYVDYLKKYKNDTYKNHLNNSKFSNSGINKSRMTSSQNNNSNYRVLYEDERENRNNGNTNFFY